MIYNSNSLLLYTRIQLCLENIMYTHIVHSMLTRDSLLRIVIKYKNGFDLHFLPYPYVNEEPIIFFNDKEYGNHIKYNIIYKMDDFTNVVLNNCLLLDPPSNINLDSLVLNNIYNILTEDGILHCIFGNMITIIDENFSEINMKLLDEL